MNEWHQKKKNSQKYQRVKRLISVFHLFHIKKKRNEITKAHVHVPTLVFQIVPVLTQCYWTHKAIIAHETFHTDTDHANCTKIHTCTRTFIHTVVFI